MRAKELDPKQYRVASTSFDTMLEQEKDFEYMIDALMEQLGEEKDCIINFVAHKLSEVKHE